VTFTEWLNQLNNSIKDHEDFKKQAKTATEQYEKDLAHATVLESLSPRLLFPKIPVKFLVQASIVLTVFGYWSVVFAFWKAVAAVAGLLIVTGATQRNLLLATGLVGTALYYLISHM
jgi:hypothetical protein